MDTQKVILLLLIAILAVNLAHLFIELSKPMAIAYDFKKYLKKYRLPQIDEFDPKLGNGKDVIIFEFTDYQCPFCARHNLNTVPKIKEYIDKGKITYVYKDFPLGFHLYATPAAKYVNCVYKLYPNKFYDFRKEVFENQINWTNNNYKKFFKKLIESLGMDYNKIESCANSEEVTKDIIDDLKDARYFKLDGTPGFVVAIRSDKIDEEKFYEIKDKLEEVTEVKTGITRDGKYILFIFSGALPFDYFQPLLDI